MKSFLTAVSFSCILFSSACSIGQTQYNYRQVAVTQLRNGLYFDALNTLNEAIKHEPGSHDLYFFRGYAKFGLDDYIGAEADYSRSIDIFPYQPDVYINRAIVRSQQEKFPEAFKDFDHALELDSANASIYLNRARINLFTKRFDECINDCYHAIRIDDSDETVYLLKGSAEMGMGNHYTAIASFQKVLQKNPGNPFGPVQMGAAWMELERPDSALCYFNRAIGIDSVNIFALFNRAIALSQLSDQHGALKDLNRVIDLSPYNSYAYFNRAVILSELKEKSAAIRDLTKVIRFNPENLISYYYRGLLRAETGDLQGALEDFTKTVGLYPGYADGYLARSAVKKKLKDMNGAEADNKMALETAKRNQNRPDTLNFDETNFLKNLIRLNGSFEEMNTFGSKFQNQYIDIKLSPAFDLFFGQAPYDQLELYDSYPKEHYYASIITLSNRHYLMTDSSRWETVARQTLVLDSVSRNPESYLIRAEAFSGLKEYERAIGDCNEALKLDPDFVLLYFARANARYGQYLQRQEEMQPDRPPGIINTAETEPDNLRFRGDSVIMEALMTDFENVIRLDPGFPFSYYNRGVVRASLGNYREALADFTKAVELRKNFPDGYYNLGLMYLLLKENHPGCRYLSQAGELGVADAYRVMKRFCHE